MFELFAGAAGASIALRTLGIQGAAVYIFENGDASDTLLPTLAKHRKDAVIMHDVNALLGTTNTDSTRNKQKPDFKLLRDIMRHHVNAKRVLVIAGFPCQDLSRANKHG